MDYENIIIIDTETTGLKDEDRIIQIALLVVDLETMQVKERHVDLCRPPLKIKEDATLIHKKTNDMVDKCPVLKKTKTYKKLVELNKKENIFVFHNSLFDLYMLAKEKFMTKASLIDTLTCAYHIFPESSSFKLETLIDTHCSGSTRQKHDALSDCMMCMNLLKVMCEKYTRRTRIKKLIEYTKSPIIGFGKYKGMQYTDLAKKDQDYLVWLLNNYNTIDLPTKLIIQSLITPKQLTESDIKGLRYLQISHLRML